MIDNLIKFLDRISADFTRLAVLVALVIFINWIDSYIYYPESYIYLTSIVATTSITLIVIGISHIVRRALFPSLDLKEFAREALQEPVAAAIVFLAVCIVLSVIIYTNISLLV